MKLSFKKTAILGSIGTGLLSASVFVHAALPAAVATDVAEAKTDILAALALVISAMVAVWGLMKLASKMGWK